MIDGRTGGQVYAWAAGEAPPVLQPHGAAKHEVLRDYLRRYFAVLTRPPRRRLTLTVVDGFAGGGEYRVPGGRDLVPGSPLILLEEIDRARVEAAGHSPPCVLNVKFHFVERDRGSFLYLDGLLRHSSWRGASDGTIYPHRGDFKERLPTLLGRVAARSPQAGRCLFLLDQCGWKDAPLLLIRRILETFAKAEVVLTLATDFLLDHLADTPALRKAAAHFGVTGDEFDRLLEKKDQSGGRFLAQNLLIRSVVRETQARFYTSFFVRSPASHRSYWLLHFANHARAHDEMTRAHWGVANASMHHGGTGLNAIGFTPFRGGAMPLPLEFDDEARSRVRDAVTDDLLGSIYAARSTPAGGVVYGDLYAREANGTCASSDIFGEALCRLRGAREIEIVAPDGKTRPRAGRPDWGDLIRPTPAPFLFPGLKLDR